MFSKDQRFWILAHVFKGLRVFGLWLMFLENQISGSCHLANLESTKLGGIQG